MCHRANCLISMNSSGCYSSFTELRLCSRSRMAADLLQHLVDENCTPWVGIFAHRPSTKSARKAREREYRSAASSQGGVAGKLLPGEACVRTAVPLMLCQNWRWAMRAPAIVASGFSALVAASPATADTGGPISSAEVVGSMCNDPSADFCVGFLAAVWSQLYATQTRCELPAVNKRDLPDIYRVYLLKNPDLNHVPASIAATKAFEAHTGCPRWSPRSDGE